MEAERKIVPPDHFGGEGGEESPTPRDALLLPSHYPITREGKWEEGEIFPGVIIRRGLLCFDIKEGTEGWRRDLAERLVGVARDIVHQEGMERKETEHLSTALALACAVADLRAIRQDGVVRPGALHESPSSAARNAAYLADRVASQVRDTMGLRLFSELH